MSGEKGIESLLSTAMDRLRGMMNVNTVVGDAIKISDDISIIPISKVSLGFVAGGGEYGTGKISPDAVQDLPFGGGSGGGMSVSPIGFLVVNQGQVRFIPVDGQMPLEKLVDMAPDLINKVTGIFEKKES